MGIEGLECQLRVGGVIGGGGKLPRNHYRPHAGVGKDRQRTRDSDAKVNMASVCPRLAAYFSNEMTVAVFL